MERNRRKMTMQWIIENWFLLVALAAIIGCGVFAIYKFAGLPTEQQIANIKQWLVLAVTNAERELGGGTGQLKLRYVYDLFVSKYPAVAKVISFDTFSLWVDEALEQMKYMLSTNAAVKNFVNNTATKQEETE